MSLWFPYLLPQCWLQSGCCSSSHYVCIPGRKKKWIRTKRVNWVYSSFEEHTTNTTISGRPSLLLQRVPTSHQQISFKAFPICKNDWEMSFFLSSSFFNHGIISRFTGLIYPVPSVHNMMSSSFIGDLFRRKGQKKMSHIVLFFITSPMSDQ